MTVIPLVLRLRKQAHRRVAEAQDLVVKELYGVFDGAVLHGGTAIWRCFQGNRFSEDIDAYLPGDVNRVGAFFKNLERAGFIVKKRKTTDNALYSNLEYNGTVVRFEALFRIMDGSLSEFEASDGNVLMVYTLTPEELVNEKTAAYLNRLKVRDLYDVFYLLSRVKDRDKVRKGLERLIREYKPPADEEDLKVLIIEGLTPPADKMLDYIRRWSHG
ncbi:MAG: nucleotidyl transferase AbiEii/AbiGii toxin family protein [Candidatus Altiarchaeota archaeon]|nr:nucleotidyl transferase AbiEii/AbiGii toxin family protein [Candidatus Altiarchaeota archaeon]